VEPYSSWQRGSNENANGLLREFLPKKTDLAKVLDAELENALSLINNRPRKCLKIGELHTKRFRKNFDKLSLKKVGSTK
jgi:transposase, IS30 family